jgi:hypothetical protein
MADTVLKLDADNSAEVDNGVLPISSTFVAVRVSGPQDANELLVFTGTAIILFEIPPSDQEEGVTTGHKEVDIILAKNLASDSDFRGSASYATLATLGNDDKDEFGYRVARVKTVVRPDGALRVIANLSVGFDANLVRMSYQAFVLARPAIAVMRLSVLVRKDKCYG